MTPIAHPPGGPATDLRAGLAPSHRELDAPCAAVGSQQGSSQMAASPSAECRSSGWAAAPRRHARRELLGRALGVVAPGTRRARRDAHRHECGMRDTFNPGGATVTRQIGSPLARSRAAAPSPPLRARPRRRPTPPRPGRPIAARALRQGVDRGSSSA